MENDIWSYCREVANILDNRRLVLDDMDAVRVSFDNEWTASECAETILERRHSLKL